MPTKVEANTGQGIWKGTHTIQPGESLFSYLRKADVIQVRKAYCLPDNSATRVTEKKVILLSEGNITTVHGWQDKEIPLALQRENDYPTQSFFGIPGKRRIARITHEGTWQLPPPRTTFQVLSLEKYRERKRAQEKI